MSPLTRPTSNSSLSTQPAVMDEYADAIEALKELPAGIARTQDFTAFTDFPITSADALTGWSWNDLHAGGSASVDAVIFAQGTGSIRARMKAYSVIGKLYYDAPSAISLTQGANTHRYAALRLRWDQEQTGNAGKPHDNVKVVIADGVGLAGNRVELIYPFIPQNLWCDLVIDISTLSSVRSVGLEQFNSGYQTAEVWSYSVLVDDVRLKGMSEKDLALGSGSPVGVVVSPTYVPAQPEVHPPIIDSTKTVMDLRPGKQFISGLGGKVDIRQFGLDETGTTDVTGAFCCILTYLPEGSTLVFPSDATFRVDWEIDMRRKNKITLDGQGCTLYTSRRRSLYPDLSTDHFFNVQGNDITIRNFRMFGYKKSVLPGNQFLNVVGTPTVGDGELGVGTAKLLDAQNEEVRVRSDDFVGGGKLATFYARDKDLNWKFEFRLSDSAQIANDCELRIIRAYPGGRLTGKTLFSKVLTLTASPTTYAWTVRPSDTDARERIFVMVRKRTAAANTIKVHSGTEYGHVYFGLLDPPYSPAVPADGGTSGIYVEGPTSNLLIENCHIEGMGTDAFHCISNPLTLITGVTIRGCTFRANDRHAMAWDAGDDLLVESTRLLQSGWHGVDVESAQVWQIAKRAIFRDVEIDGCLGGFICVNWATIEDLVVENMLIRAVGNTGFQGGSRRGRLHNISVLRSDWDWAADSDVQHDVYFTITGRDMNISNITALRRFAVLTDSKDYEDGGSILTGPVSLSTATVIPVLDLSAFPTTGTGRIATHVIGYFSWTGKSAASGAGNLTGIFNASTGNFLTGDIVQVRTLATSGGNRVSNVRVVNPHAGSVEITDTGGTLLYGWTGTGTPEGAIAASPGSTFIRTDGGAGTTFYVKETGTGSTGWAAK